MGISIAYMQYILRGALIPIRSNFISDSMHEQFHSITTQVFLNLSSKIRFIVHHFYFYAKKQYTCTSTAVKGKIIVKTTKR